MDQQTESPAIEIAPLIQDEKQIVEHVAKMVNSRREISSTPVHLEIPPSIETGVQQTYQKQQIDKLIKADSPFTKRVLGILITINPDHPDLFTYGLLIQLSKKVGLTDIDITNMTNDQLIGKLESLSPLIKQAKIIAAKVLCDDQIQQTVMPPPIADYLTSFQTQYVENPNVASDLYGRIVGATIDIFSGHLLKAIINREQISEKISHPEEDRSLVKKAIEKNPQHERQINELIGLYCDPRLHNCQFEGDKIFYTDPQTDQKRELKPLSKDIIGHGGTKRTVYEGPTEGTVIKITPTGDDYQSEMELGTYVDLDIDKLVKILGFRRVPIGANPESLVLLEERVTPITHAMDAYDIKDLKFDIDMLEREKTRGYPILPKETKCGPLTLEEMKAILELYNWGATKITDPGLNNMGRTSDNRFVFLDFGCPSKYPESETFFRKGNNNIDFEAIRMQNK